MAARARAVLFVLRTLKTGGTERQTELLIRGLHPGFFHCWVFALESEGPLAEVCRQLGVPVVSGGLAAGDLERRPWKALAAEWRLLVLLRRLRPMVVQGYLPLVTFMAALAGRLSRVPLVITGRRALGTHQERHPLLKPLDGLAACLSHRVTVNSRAVAEDVLRRHRLDRRKLALIYNGLATERIGSGPERREAARRALEISRDEKVVITVANLLPYKGHRDLFEAAALVVAGCPEARFLLAGEDRGILKDLARQSEALGIRHRVRFLGSRDDVFDLLAAADLCAVPSREEGFSNVILEAMAAGLPVVATRVGGNPEAVLEGQTGYLVPPRDPRLLAERILDLLGDPPRAKAWGLKGRERVLALFSAERMVHEHLALYQNAEEPSR